MELVLSNLELYAPVILGGLRLTDDEFLEFCAEHEDLRVESNLNGEVELMPGTGPDTGHRNMDLAIQFGSWSKQMRRGRAFDSSTMFVLPSGARRSPDLSWISHARIETVPPEQRGHLWHMCPEFVIELRSPSDRPPLLAAKMREWMANGVELGWSIDPVERTVTIYRGTGDPELRNNPESIEGEGPVAGFVLDLTEVWSAA